MGTGGTPQTVWPPGDPGERFRVRRARLSDVGKVARIYRGQSAASRVFYHPYPFDPLRSRLVFAYMVISERLLRLTLRRLPNVSFCLQVLEEVAGPVFGFGTIRFVSDRRHPETWARFGFLVAEDRQRQGGGTLLVEALYDRALQLGIRRGGGTIRASNLASVAVVQRFGFRLQETDEVDRNAMDGGSNLADIQELEPVLARVRQAKRERIAASTPPDATSAGSADGARGSG